MIKRMDNVLIVVDDLEAVIIGEMQYENAYRLAYIRVPEGIIVVAEQMG